ncbi:MAG: TonB family protein [Gammaproteobacteria bacterium]
MNWAVRDTRFLWAMMIGGLVSFALFLFMHQLIATNPQAFKAPPTINSIGMVKVHKPKLPPPVRNRVPERPKHQTPPPMQNPIASPVTTPHTPITFKLTPIPGGTDGQIPGRNTVAENSGGSSLGVAFRFTPQYPPQAAIQGVEGYVKTCFTVASDGSVVSPYVTGASSPQARELLGQAALQTILRWKFFARKVNGKAVATSNVCQNIQFTLH